MIIPVILCGGSGTRLWPLSRKSYPKQFTDLLGEDSLFQSTVRRLSGPGYDDPLIVTSNDFRFIVSEQLEETGIAPSGILIEPEGRNTAPAAAAAALACAARDPEAMMLLAASDHAIPDAEAFRAAVTAGTAAAADGRIVLFGIEPQRPETGYGWLEVGAQSHPGVKALISFIEKPDPERAQELFETGRLWNSGIFLTRAETLIAAFRAHAPQVLARAEAALAGAASDLGFTRLEPGAWAEAEDVSIDYAVMEKADNLSVVPYAGHWSDLGSWAAVWMETAQDADGNALSEHAMQLGCSGSLLRSESEDIEVVGIGLKNQAVIAMKDAVLVTDMDNSQNVKTAVAELKKRQVKQAVQLPVDFRPWGWFESLVIGERFQVKRIHVHPGAALSLQSHHHRSEHWIVVQGTAKVTVDDEVKLVTENESVYIPLGAVHRMENPGKVPMVLIEVQTGTYLGEDDIVRYEDVYARS